MLTQEQIRSVSRFNYLRVSENAVLAWIRITDDVTDTINVHTNGAAANNINGYWQTPDSLYAYALFPYTGTGEAGAGRIEIFRGDNLLSQMDNLPQRENRREEVLSIYSRISAAHQQHFFNQLTHAAVEFGLVHSPVFIHLCHALRLSLSATHFNVSRSYWLAPNVLFFEGEAESIRPDAEPKILILTNDRFDNITSRFVQLAEKTFAFVIVFPTEYIQKYAAHALCTYFTGGKPVIINGLNPCPAFGLEFTDYLNSVPLYQRAPLQEIICRTVMDFSPEHLKENAGELIRKLQIFIKFPVVSCTSPDNPFSLQFDKIIPVGAEGVFACGWMRDPYKMLESITMHSDLGFSCRIDHTMFRLKRQDVEDAYKNSQHGGFSENMGFVFYAPLPAHITAHMQGMAELYSVYFTAHLKGGITYDIRPEIMHQDSFAARDFVTKSIHTSQVTDDMITQCIGPVASSLQARCMNAINVRRVYEYGKAAENPKVSIVIPLYQRLDFIRLQFVKMGNDPTMRNCEVIYVLDSPWQESEVKDIISELTMLYRLPVKLVIMERNAGYAGATNTGTTYARGEYVVLLNSDVIPTKAGWAVSMADFYAATPNVGALAPKLLYEDDSLQHAGLFFTKATFPVWINLHYYKGFPGNFPAGSINRPVPAVTGACLMVRRDLWQEVGMLTTDYIIGDFEDSDLCLKLAARGLNNWYYADAELYHLERQSVPLNSSYADSLAWRYNSRIHTERWDGLITSLMAQYGEV